MSATRPGADRLAKQAATTAKTTAERALADHMRECITCRNAGSDPHMHCSYWWDQMCIAHAAKRVLRKYAQPETVNLNSLFGDDTQCFRNG